MLTSRYPFNPVVSQADLPIIDLSDFHAGTGVRRQVIADRAIQACESSGFFYVTGHGIDEQTFQKTKQTALQFFRGDHRIKEAVHISHFPHHRGYVGHRDVYPDTEKGGDIREAYKVAWHLPESDPDYQAGITLYGPNVWPQDMPAFEKDVYDLYLNFQNLAKNIFQLFAIGLNLEAAYFEPLIQKPASVMNVNYYPATEPGNEASGIGAHSDYEAFAMLWQDNVGGLQIESLEGEWQAVEPVENALVINIGDLMSRWTNDRFRATRHRVINTSGKERVSFACFGNTNYHAEIECIPSCYDASNPAKYPKVIAGEYLMGAIKKTYAYTQ